MPIAGSRPTDRHRLMRHIQVVRGSMRFMMEIKPRFDYGRLPHKLEISDEGAVFHADGLELTMHSVGPRGASAEELGLTVERVGDDLRLLRTLHEGQTAGVVLESMGGKPRRIPTGELDRAWEETARYWRNWLRPVHLHRPLAGDRDPLGHDAQADDLRADRARWSRRPPPGCPSRPAASATGTTATPGSGTPRSPSTPCSGSATWRRRPRSASGSGTGWWSTGPSTAAR